MAGLNDVKTRIVSVTNTRQITKAMNLVATIKYKKAKENTEHMRTYLKAYENVVKNIYNYRIEKARSELTDIREINKSLAVVISSDRGLCGAYNSSILKFAAQKMEGKAFRVITVGNKARDFFRKTGHELLENYENISDTVEYHDARIIALSIMRLYRKMEIDEVIVYYNRFESTIKYTPTELGMLPLVLGEPTGDSNYIYEPSPEDIFDAIASGYIVNRLYTILLEASASEHSSRMTSMSSATDNADKMIEELTLQYNRARQASITNEISEIVGGTEALK
ncbi:MAG TPA: ATP synthase F1 subunit gamma [Clostridia bacterium]|nr:ATP synthase F1 subunit gamma [Clostridia bacterium]